MTYFILRAYTGTGVSHSQHRKKSGEVLEKNAGEWTGRVEISKEEIPGSKRSMYGYILTYSRLYRENVARQMFIRQVLSNSKNKNKSLVFTCCSVSPSPVNVDHFHLKRIVSLPRQRLGKLRI